MEASVQIARGHPDYGGLVDRVNAMVTAIVPSSETVLVVSKGDESLLRLGSRRGWHFPRSPDGRYAGYYPADSADAIAQLEELRKREPATSRFPPPRCGGSITTRISAVTWKADTSAW